jgi:hypothetical protein
MPEMSTHEMPLLLTFVLIAKLSLQDFPDLHFSQLLQPSKSTLPVYSTSILSWLEFGA